MFVLRWMALANPGWTLLLALFIYYAAIVWLHWDHGNKWLIFQPFCLVQSHRGSHPGPTGSDGDSQT